MAFKHTALPFEQFQADPPSLSELEKRASQVQPYIDKQRVFSMDGDLYLVSVPTMELIRDIKVACRNKKICVDISEFSRVNDFKLYRKENNSEESRSLDTNRNTMPDLTWSISSDMTSRITCGVSELARYFRPVLIPLSKEGLIDLSYQTENPDGSLVHGGRLELFYRDNIREVEILNSDAAYEDESWMWWNGLLVGLTPHVKLTAAELYIGQLATDILYKIYTPRWGQSKR